ncbi:hypothetical protein CHLNCDRAFT_140227 [Chlorella variabilis]|uniref:Uncharacterized protein n=1 Tax=Chlorella variabilis TaxID=554065 RepID=E1ZRU5_CHLVA|nr:hypothetical protein CHLNCDRAFT_140227 [Chlorella variabilis]EFN51522.1 hypothetical protein CHLNCDRAFT_140227 [Chlorella variabilis]|eukprot:XP_005843624.1 hypothetical protein CHLNCDRAFT_140227 [Chlorella variabilis]
MQYVLPAGSAEATSIDCRWRDQFILNTSQVAASGSVLYVVGARALAYSDPVPSGVGIAGTVVRNATGNLWQQQLPLNLTAQAKAGWNKITLQGKADSINTLTTSSGLLQQTTGVTSMTLSAATAADQPFLLLSFDLSFLAARGVTIINATVFLRLTATGGAAMTQDVVGSGRLLPARDTNGYVELRLDAKYAGRYAGKSRLLQLAVAMARLPGGHQRLLGVVAAAVLLVMLIGAGTGTLPPVLDATPAATGIFATCVAAVYCCPWRPRQRRSRPFPWRRAVDEGSDEDVPPRRMRRKAAVKANRGEWLWLVIRAFAMAVVY